MLYGSTGNKNVPTTTNFILQHLRDTLVIIHSNEDEKKFKWCAQHEKQIIT